MPKILQADSKNCYLIGELIAKISEEKLPTNKDVLSRFIHCRTTALETVSKSLTECGTVVENIWALANISTQNHYRVVNKIKSLYSQWTALKKNKSRQSKKQKEQETLFSASLEMLFDISYNSSLQKIENADKERLGLQGSVILVSHKLVERQEYWQKLLKIQQSEDTEDTLPVIQTEDIDSNNNASETDSATLESKDNVENDASPENDVAEMVRCKNKMSETDPNVAGSNVNEENDTSSENDVEYFAYVTDMSLAASEVCVDSDSEDTAVDSDSDEEYLPPSTYRKKVPKKKVIMTPELSEALDRTGTSNRAAVFILAFAAVGMGLNPENMVINRESFRQSRQNHSRESAIQMQQNFDPNTALVLHWDGKLLPNSNLNKKVDRIAVIVTGHGISQLLGIPFLLESAKGKSQAELVVETIRKWDKVEPKIEFLCFDTTSVNSGRIEGTLVWLQKLMGKRLISLACRHHIMELNAAVAFQTAFNEKSKSGNIHLFEEFRKIWPDIDKNNYESCVDDAEVIKHILPIKNELVAFVKNQLLNFPQIRDDYKELLMLTLLVIGEKAPDYKIGIVKTYVVHTCGALHRARWMARLIYAMKIYLYRSQFVLTDDELSGLKHFIVFVLAVYIENWYQAPCSLTAAKNDLKLLQAIATFKEIHSDISAATMKTFCRHLWYISEELVGTAFFDDSLDVSEKRLMVKALKKRGTSNPAVRAKINVEDVMQYRISDFVTSNSLSIFRALNISQEFLKTDPMTWSNREDYKAAREFVKSLKVVNDVAERAIALGTDFNGQLTSDDDQWQYYLRGVEHNRKVCPNSNKKTVLQCIKD